MSSDSDEAEFESADEGDYPYEGLTENVEKEQYTALIEDCSRDQKGERKHPVKPCVDANKGQNEGVGKLLVKSGQHEEKQIEERLENEKEFKDLEQVVQQQHNEKLNEELAVDESSTDNETLAEDVTSCAEDSRLTEAGLLIQEKEILEAEDKAAHGKQQSETKEETVNEINRTENKVNEVSKTEKTVDEISKTEETKAEKNAKAKPRPERKKLGKRIGISQGELQKREDQDSKQKTPLTLRIEKSVQERKEKEESQEQQEDESAAWGWGWKDLSSTLISTASVGVTTISEHVTHGVDTVLEVVDSIAPSPEELARRDVERQKQTEKESSMESPENPTEDENEKVKREVPAESSTGTAVPKESSGGFGIFSSVWGSASSKVLSTGLNTLEFIGKKTMDVIQDGDPGLMKKRALLKGNTTSLSQTLREAREEAEKQQQQVGSGDAQTREVKDSFALYFDDYQGLVHLEALELLSRQCDASLHKAMLNLSGGQLADVQDSLASIEEILAVAEQSEGDEDDVDIESANRELEQLLGHIDSLHLSVCTESIQKAWKQTCEWAYTDSMESASRAFSASVQIIARVTASSVEVFHRLAQQLLLPQEDSPSRARVMRGVTESRRLFCRAVSREASAFSQALTRLIGDHSLITDIFLEASSGSEYISNACQLLVPVLQLQVVRD